jgi:hypothetical protein
MVYLYCITSLVLKKFDLPKKSSAWDNIHQYLCNNQKLVLKNTSEKVDIVNITRYVYIIERSSLLT